MRTTGSTIIVPTRGKGGLYYDINPLDLQIAQMPEMDLWLDGKSLVSASPLTAASRIDGAALASADVAKSPTLFGSTSTFDGPGFVFSRAAAQAILAPECVIQPSYTIISVMSFVDAAGGINGIVGHTDQTGNRLKMWGAQAAGGDPFSLNINHAASGASANIAAGSTGISAGTRYIIWVSYDAVSKRCEFGRGGTHLGGTTISTLPKTQAGITIGGTASTDQFLSGRIDAFMVLPTPIYNPFTDHASNRLRADLMALIAARYDVAL